MFDDLEGQHEIADFIGFAFPNQFKLAFILEKEKAIFIRPRLVGFEMANDVLLFSRGSRSEVENALAGIKRLRYETALRFQRDRFVEGESMSRRLGIACAAALLVAVVGCSAGSFLLSWTGANGKQQILSGSVQEVADRLQVELGKIHVIVAVNPMDNGTVRLNGQTKSGQRFCLVLKRHATSHGEQTALTVEWEKDADEQFWASVLDLLVRPAPVAPTSPDGINAGR